VNMSMQHVISLLTIYMSVLVVVYADDVNLLSKSINTIEKNKEALLVASK
jgi:hypothetical protein